MVWDYKSNYCLAFYVLYYRFGVVSITCIELSLVSLEAARPFISSNGEQMKGLVISTAYTQGHSGHSEQIQKLSVLQVFPEQRSAGMYHPQDPEPGM